MARGGKNLKKVSQRQENRRLTLVHSRSRRRVQPGPVNPGLAASGEGCLALLSWHDFLEADCRRHEGLLCFYDRPRTARVAATSRFFALWIGVLEELAAEGPPVPR